MKFTITRINRQNQLMVSLKSIDRFWERIAKDDAKQSVANFRMSAPLMEGDYHNYIGMKQWQQVYPAAEFGKDESGSLIFKKSNGLMMLHFINLTTEEEINALKKTASLLPMTFAAIKGADGRSLIVLVSIADEAGQVPQNEQDAEQLYLTGYESVKNLYLSQIPSDSKIILKAEKPTLKSSFMLTQDASPYYNSKTVAMRIARNSLMTPAAPKRVDDLKAFEDNEFLYSKVVQETQAEMTKANMKWANENDQFFAFLSAVAAKLCRMGMSEEEAFIHIRRNNWNDATEEEFRQIVGSAYATHSKDRKTEKASSGRKGRADILQMKIFLQSRYQFRYNAVMKYTEYRPNNSWVGDFNPVDGRMLKSMTIDTQLADIHVTINDVKNFLGSSHIKSYNPIETFLYDCVGKWDGKDRIRALARTVPTQNPHWEDWFYTWFLGMVDQWRGSYRRQYGNSTMPLLISKQGYNKSTFCRRLIPGELSWGFTDNMLLSEKRQVLQGMVQFLLINLDEFNQISPQIQQGFLKNLLQLPTVKIKPPYGSHVEEFPRLASFIATSNMTDILADPSGNRRFLGVELTGPIDVSGRLNYEQLYAQAMQALEQGEKSYFDVQETAVILQYNRQFEQISPIKQCFLEVFEPTNDPEKGEYMMAAAIFDILKQKFGSSLQVSSLQRLGRELQNIEGLECKKTRFGTEYLVVRK